MALTIRLMGVARWLPCRSWSDTIIHAPRSAGTRFTVLQWPRLTTLPKFLHSRLMFLLSSSEFEHRQWKGWAKSPALNRPSPTVPSGTENGDVFRPGGHEISCPLMLPGRPPEFDEASQFEASQYIVSLPCGSPAAFVSSPAVAV